MNSVVTVVMSVLVSCCATRGRSTMPACVNTPCQHAHLGLGPVNKALLLLLLFFNSNRPTGHDE